MRDIIESNYRRNKVGSENMHVPPPRPSDDIICDVEESFGARIGSM